MPSQVVHLGITLKKKLHNYYEKQTFIKKNFFVSLVWSEFDYFIFDHAVCSDYSWPLYIYIDM